MMNHYEKNKEIWLYLFFGGLSFILNLLIFVAFCRLLGMNELVANVISWLVTVCFAFVTNRAWVFSEKDNERGFFRQMLMFYVGRLTTLGVEEVMLFLLITILGFHDILVKAAAQIVVIVLNYVISKAFIFK